MNALRSKKDIDQLTIRPIRPEDKKYLVQGFQESSSETIRNRFLVTKKELSSNEINFFTEVDGERHVALVAFIDDGASQRGIGVARYYVSNQKEAEAEFSIIIIDSFQSRGVGSKLLKELFWKAKRSGIKYIVGVMNEDNVRMKRLLGKMKIFTFKYDSPGTIKVTGDLGLLS